MLPARVGGRVGVVIANRERVHASGLVFEQPVCRDDETGSQC